jgi:hypothetical protein
MKVDHIFGTRFFHKVIYVLGQVDDPAAIVMFKLGQYLMRRIRLFKFKITSAVIVKTGDIFVIFDPPLRRADLHDIVVFPKTVMVSKGMNATLGRESGTA